MADFLRRIAPAVLVGTAAVAVAASATGASGSDLTVNASAPTGSSGDTTTPDSGTTNGGGTGEPDWQEWFGDLDEDDDERGERDDDDDDAGSSAGGGGSARTVPAPAPTTQAAPDTGSGTTTTTACDTAEVVGPVVRTEWGPVQVAAKVANGRVCAVRTIRTPDGDRKSVMINARAVPVLEKQVLAAGDASIDGVSGATVTTEGYRTSLQAILDGA